MISNPFAIDPSHARDAFQLELIDILNYSNFKTAYDQQDLITFYKQHVLSETSPNLAQHAHRCIALFGSTYSCEQPFPD